jgi:hypothetical protein
MLTVFERIPDPFVQMYNSQFEQWAREFRKRGNYAAIVFDRVPGKPVLLGQDGKPVWKGAWFEAEVDRTLPQQVKVVIKPRTGHDEEMVERHCREMAPFRLN